MVLVSDVLPCYMHQAHASTHSTQASKLSLNQNVSTVFNVILSRSAIRAYHVNVSRIHLFLITGFSVLSFPIHTYTVFTYALLLEGVMHRSNHILMLRQNAPLH